MATVAGCNTKGLSAGKHKLQDKNGLVRSNNMVVTINYALVIRVVVVRIGNRFVVQNRVGAPVGVYRL